MPSVVKVEKQETVAVLESSEPTKQMLHLVENKIRNLEKRKVRLDAVRDKKHSGEELNSEQKDALDKYELVLQSIEFVKELQKSLQQQFAEGEKLAKKQQKKEKSEKQAVEQRRLRDLLFTQALLTGLTDNAVRSDFKQGINGAVLLTSEELAQLDELRTLIGSTREETAKFSAQLSIAAEHAVCLLDGRDKPVAKTTYHALQAVIKKVEDCGYFDKPKTAPVTSTTVSEGVPVVVVATESVSAASVITVPQSAVLSEIAAPVMVTMYNGNHVATFTSAGYLPTPADSHYVHHERPIQDIVTSGPFNFLQESEIETTVATGAEGAVAYLPQSIYNSTALVTQPQAVYADPYLPTTVYMSTHMGVPSAPVIMPGLSSAHYQAVAAGGAVFTIPHMSAASIGSVPISAVQPIAAEALEAQYAVGDTFSDQLAFTEQEKKPFTMNPEADEFQSMYTTAGLTFGTESQIYVNSNLSAASVEPGVITGDEVQQVQTDAEQEWHPAGGYQRNGPGQRGGARGFRGGFGRGNRRGGSGGFRGRGFFPGRGGRGGYGYGPRGDWQQNEDYEHRYNNGHHRGRGRGFYRNGADNKETTAPVTDSSPAVTADSQ